MKRFIVCTLAVFAAIVGFGQTQSDSVKVYFHIGQWLFDPTLGDNAASMDAFIERVRVASEEQNLDRIVIRSYVSPDGPDRFNQRLSVKRCDAITGLIIDRAGIGSDLIEGKPQGVSWVELRRAVAETPDVPSREKILDIIDNTPIYVFDANGRIIDGRKKQLMDLRGGAPYRWMLNNIFPKLRNGVAVSLYLKPVPPPVEPVATADTISVDTISTARRPEPMPSDTVATPDSVVTGKPSNLTAADTVAGADVDSYAPRHLFALKTNMLYYAALLPNIELEWLINDHWSVAFEGNVAWWGSYKKERSYRLALLDAEVRRWIKPRAPWHGMYVGIIAGGGWYDLEKGTPGYYGEGLMTGLSFGYMWPIGRSLSLEAEAGAGYMYTRYKEYKPLDGHHLYMRTKEMNYFGPIKAKLSIAWRFLDVNKPKRVKPAL